MAGQRTAARQPPLIGDVHDVGYYRAAVLTLGFAFFGVFGGFQAAQGLQTSVNSTLGFINLAALYGTFTVLCLIAPPLLVSLERTVGLRVVMVVSSLAYAAMALSNVYTSNWALPIATNVLVGAAAPLLWTCQNDYVGRCAYQAGKAAAGGHAEDEQVRNMTAVLNSLFFSVYQFAGATGNIAASVLMLVFAGRSWLKDVLFVFLAAVSCLGAVVFLRLPHVPVSSSSSGNECEASVPENPSLKAVAALAFGDFRMTLMIPLIVTNGMLLAFVLGDYATDITCPVAGPSFTGFVVATFFLVNCVATASWGKLISDQWISRQQSFVLAGAFQVAFLLSKLLWTHPRNYEHADGEWTRLVEPRWQDIVFTFLLVGLFALGDAFWESGAPAALQNYFLGTASVVPAMANYKGWQSLGFAVQFILGAVLADRPEVRGAILVVLCCASTLVVVLLNAYAKMQ